MVWGSWSMIRCEMWCRALHLGGLWAASPAATFPKLRYQFRTRGMHVVPTGGWWGEQGRAGTRDPFVSKSAPLALLSLFGLISTLSFCSTQSWDSRDHGDHGNHRRV